MRLPTKPRQLPTRTPTLPRVFASPMDVTITAGLLCLPRTISRSRMTFAGLKKWWPMTCCGREVAEAIASMSSVEVFEARMASGRVTRSSSAKTCFFNSIPSKTACGQQGFTPGHRIYLCTARTRPAYQRGRMLFYTCFLCGLGVDLPQGRGGCENNLLVLGFQRFDQGAGGCFCARADRRQPVGGRRADSHIRVLQRLAECRHGRLGGRADPFQGVGGCRADTGVLVLQRLDECRQGRPRRRTDPRQRHAAKPANAAVRIPERLAKGG